MALRVKLPQSLLLASACLSLVLSSSRSSGREETPSNNVVQFKTYVNGSKGVVRCGIFTQKGWLKDPVAPATAAIRGNSAICVFNKIPKGTYGISAFHDENNNGKIDTNLLGMPTEDYCASRNARGTFGPPSFDDAKFQYKGGTVRLEARMK